MFASRNTSRPSTEAKLLKYNTVINNITQSYYSSSPNKHYNILLQIITR